MTHSFPENISPEARRFIYTLHLGDNALIIAQRDSEWTGHGPVLEQDIAITNISLDALGQARNFYQHAAAVYNGFDKKEKAEVDFLMPQPWKAYDRELQEDDLAFLRDERQYLNLLITELPIGDWAFTIQRQFFFSAFQYYQYTALQSSVDAHLAGIAEKSIKEVTYHLRWSSEWMVRLGTSTEEAKIRLTHALESLWSYTGEMHQPAPFELGEGGFAADLSSVNLDWTEKVKEILAMAEMDLPKQTWMQKGGKTGEHTEHLGYLLTEMQYMQRTYPNSEW